MANKDTIELLKECNAGIKMGVASMDEVLPKVKNQQFKQLLTDCKTQHDNLGNETHTLLNEFGESGKEPGAVAKGMAWVKTNAMLKMQPNDKTVADLMTDGCNMGVKSLNQYLNEYGTAEERAKDITRRLIGLEEKLSVDIRPFL